MTGTRKVQLTNGVLYVDGLNRICELHYSKTHVSLTSAKTWTFIETVSQIANYPPKDIVYSIGSNLDVMSRVFSSGSIQAYRNTAAGDFALVFSVLWSY